MNDKDLKVRTKKFALNIINLAGMLPKTPTGKVVHYQLVKSGTSVAANYRAACRGRSKAEFISKMGIVVEEADESGFWLEMIKDARLIDNPVVSVLPEEANEITSIMNASHKTASRAERNRKSAVVNRKKSV